MRLHPFASLLLPLLAGFDCSLFAQIPNGYAIVRTNTNLYAVDATNPTPTATPITNTPANLIANATAMEFEQAFGGILLATTPTVTSVPEIHRLTLSGLSVSSATLFASFPTMAAIRDIYREPGGCFLVLCDDGAWPVPNPTLFRVVSTPAGAAVTPEAFTITSPPTAAGMWAAVAGNGANLLYLAYRPSSTAQASTIYSIAGGIASPWSVQPSVRGSTLEFNPLSPMTLVTAGNAITSAGPNYFCGSFGQTVGRCGGSPFVSCSTVIDLHVEGANVLAGMNFAGSGEIGRIAGACPSGPYAQLLTFPGEFVLNVVSVAATSNYGCACLTSAGAVPLIAQSGPAVQGGSWTTTVFGGLAFPNSFAVLTMGSQATVAAIGNGCLFLNNIELQFPGATDGSGTSTSAVFNIPVDPALNGASFYSQWTLLNPITSELRTTAGLANTL